MPRTPKTTRRLLSATIGEGIVAVRSSTTSRRGASRKSYLVLNTVEGTYASFTKDPFSTLRGSRILPSSGQAWQTRADQVRRIGVLRLWTENGLIKRTPVYRYPDSTIGAGVAALWPGGRLLLGRAHGGPPYVLELSKIEGKRVRLWLKDDGTGLMERGARADRTIPVRWGFDAKTIDRQRLPNGQFVLPLPLLRPAPKA